MKKLITATLLAVCLLAGATTAASASAPENVDLADGPLSIKESGSYVVTQTGGSTENAITIEGGVVDMTISGLNVEAEGMPAIYVEAGATLNLTVEGENSLTGGAGFAGICVEPAYDADWNYDADASAKLYISGSGTLTATGGDGDDALGTYGGGAGIGGNGEDQLGGDAVDFGLVNITSEFTGTINACGGASSYYVDGENCFGGGAGIGGGGFNMGYINNYEDVSPYYWGEVYGAIEIHGGVINATSRGNGSGIGGGGGQGEDSAASHITVDITSCVINATGGTIGAGIGGGAICDGGYISISGATVRAEAGANEDSMGAAGIGGSNNSSVSSVIISGGAQVTATARGGAAGIGGGTNTSYSNVHFGDVDGVLTPEKVGIISISGEGTTVSARGGTSEGFSGFYGGAGIGSGYPTANNARSVAFDISITDGASVRAYGGYHAQAIGYGYRPSSSTYYTGYGITLTLDDTIFLWAQNADYYQPALVAATEYDSSPISYSSDNDIYLTHYVDAEREPADGAGSSEVPGYLNQPAAAADETFDWVFDEETYTVSIGPVTVVDEVTGLNGNWATLCTVEPITISLADLIIYVGGAGYESTVTTEDGETVATVSDGLPEPGFTIELPADIDAALKAAVGHEGSGPLDLSQYLSFSYDDGKGNTRSWTLERYDNKPGNDSMAYGHYIYRIVPAEGQNKVRLEFTDEDGQTSTSDDFDIILNDQYHVYSMTIYPGALDPKHLKAVVTFPNESMQEFSLDVEAADLIIRGVVDDEDGTEPVTDVITDEPTSEPSDITAQVPAGTLFYINESSLEVEHWDAVKLLADKIIPAAEEILLGRTYEDFEQITEEYSYEYRYLDLVDTSNGNVWVTASEDITVYWPYPEGTDANDDFYIVHYKGLDRQYDDNLATKDYETELFSVENGKLEKTEYGIKITVDSFSPFALFWKESKDPWPPITPTPTPSATPTPTPSATPTPSVSPDIPPIESEKPEESPEPSEPVQPSEPVETPAPIDPGIPDEVPETGDTTGISLWLTLAAASLIGLVCVLLGLRRLDRGRRR